MHTNQGFSRLCYRRKLLESCLFVFLFPKSKNGWYMIIFWCGSSFLSALYLMNQCWIPTKLSLQECLIICRANSSPETIGTTHSRLKTTLYFMISCMTAAELFEGQICFSSYNYWDRRHDQIL